MLLITELFFTKMILMLIIEFITVRVALHFSHNYIWKPLNQVEVILTYIILQCARGYFLELLMQRKGCCEYSSKLFVALSFTEKLMKWGISFVYSPRKTPFIE